MSTFNLRKEIPLWIIAVLPMAYLASIWNVLPETVPTHFNTKGEADGWGSKNMLIWLPLAMTVGTYLLMSVIPKLDPKKKLDQMGNKYYLIKMFMVIMMAGLSFFIIHSAKTGSIGGEGKWIFVITGAMIAILGNYMPSMKPNYFVGIRTPWTLESETVWKKTHRLAGKIWVPAGLILCVLPFVISTELFMPIFLIILAIIVVIPLVYSYQEFKSESNSE